MSNGETNNGIEPTLYGSNDDASNNNVQDKAESIAQAHTQVEEAMTNALNQTKQSTDQTAKAVSNADTDAIDNSMSKSEAAVSDSVHSKSD